MSLKAFHKCLFASLLISLYSQVVAQTTVQTGSNVFNGRPFLWVEAENFSSRSDDPDNNAWKVVSKENPFNSTQGLPILPATSNVSGTALLDDNGGAQHETALYQMQFATAGTYQLYTRHTMYDVNGNGNYGNEDSIFVSPAFNKNSQSDWVGFEGREFDETDATVDVPTPGFGLDPDGFKVGVGDSGNDGWLATRDWGVKSGGVVTFPNSAAGTEWNGNFNWYNRPAFVSTNSAGGFDGEYGFKTEYVVTAEMVGQTVTFEIGTREPYVAFDGFLFIQDDNVDLLDMFTQQDLNNGILPKAVTGDYNGNGTVDAADYAVWRNGDSPDDTQAGYDLWKANFGKTGGTGSVAAAAVPEPASALMLLAGTLLWFVGRPRR